MLVVGERVPVVVDVVVGEFDGRTGGALSTTTGASCVVKQRASSGAWVGAAVWIGTKGLKGGTKKQEKA